MDKLLADLRHAADNLVVVARGLHTPLDTSTFEAALAAVENAAKPKTSSVFKSPSQD
jgi:hypothetical protein